MIVSPHYCESPRKPRRTGDETWRESVYCAPNKIVAENCKPGNPRTEWDINADGDPSIQGFATEMSVNVGESIDFKIRTHSPRYRIDIYRMGWAFKRQRRPHDSVVPAGGHLTPGANPIASRLRNVWWIVATGRRPARRVPPDAVSGV